MSQMRPERETYIPLVPTQCSTQQRGPMHPVRTGGQSPPPAAAAGLSAAATTATTLATAIAHVPLGEHLPAATRGL